MKSVHSYVRPFFFDHLFRCFPVVCQTKSNQQRAHYSNTSPMTISTMDKNWDTLSSLPTSPVHSSLNLPGVRGARIPRRNTEIRGPRELILPWQLTSAIYDGRVARWQFIRGIGPPSYIQTLRNLSIWGFPTGKPSNE